MTAIWSVITQFFRRPFVFVHKENISYLPLVGAFPLTQRQVIIWLRPLPKYLDPTLKRYASNLTPSRLGCAEHNESCFSTNSASIFINLNSHILLVRFIGRITLTQFHFLEVVRAQFHENP